MLKILLLALAIAQGYASESTIQGGGPKSSMNIINAAGEHFPAIVVFGTDGYGYVSPLKPIAPTATSTVSANVTTASVQIIGANPKRRGFTIWNNSANSAYVSFSTVSTSSTPTFILPTFTQYIHMLDIIYTGPISAIRNSGSGTMTVWELNAP